ncbi:MAG: error-prone DNA polymerase [Bryobacteraceae bacterium]|jgi:error-prone DNA polymerase
MSSPAYIELHARSAFSFLRGAAIPEEYIELAATHNSPAMALTDVDGVYGSPRFHMSAKKAGINAHIGAEITAQHDGKDDKSRYTLLVQSRTGYQNLCRLVTRMKLRAGPKPSQPAATESDFEEFAEGLLCLTGGDEGPLALGLINKNAPEVLERLTRIFGPHNVYVELQRHFDRNEESRNQAAMDLARSLHLPLVATNGVCHATRFQREILDVFTCLHHKTTLAEAGRLLARNSERHLKSPAEMTQIFADIPEAIANTQAISSRLGFTLSDLGYQFPEYPLPPGETISSFLWKLTDEGARRRYQPYHDRARHQIERELALIERLGLGGYFLIVWDLVRFARENGILCQGRGSAANSAVCYSLGITAVDPVGMDLLFERFLSDERGAWPDIDIDFPSGDQRERVIQYVYERYGQYGAAMTANVITYRGRLAAREAGKVLGFDVTTLDKVSSLAPMWGYKDPEHTKEKQFREAGLDLTNPKVRKFLDIVVGLQDMPRHLGQHSGGMVLCQGRLDQVVPLEPASMSGRVVVQWDKEDCADLGIIKVDLLGLGMMAVLEDCLKLVRNHWREEIDLGQLPANDPAVYQTLQKGDTIGMFQVESRAQMATLPRMKPENFYDLVVEVAIIRPGPIVGNMVHPYLNRRSGREPVDPLHPMLEPVLKRTLGVPLFQEQLLRMAMIAANFTGGEAEELRRAMGFKRSKQRMLDIEARLRAGMEQNGIVGQTQDRIVQSITSFALYGFPESHAASFALLAYASAYFKCHYLAAFTCALLNNQPMGFYHPAVLIKDAQRHGLRVLPVDVNVSEWDCTIERNSTSCGVGLLACALPFPSRAPASPSGAACKQAVDNAEGTEHALRLGLRYIRGLRAEAGKQIAAARPFQNVDDLAQRVPKLHKDELEKLASAGALANLGTAHRRDALWKAGRAGRPTGPLLENVPESDRQAPLQQMTIAERLSADYNGTGLTVGRHPMHFLRPEMNELGVTTARDLAKIRHGALVRVAGSVIVRQRPGTAKGIMFLSMEDETGIANIVVMPDMFDERRLILVTEPYLLVEGKVQNVDNIIHVLARRVEKIEPITPAMTSHDFK